MSEQSLIETTPISRDIIARGNKYIESVREAGKQSRKNFTDTIKQFCRYVDPQGDHSSDPEEAYKRYTQKLYSPLGLNSKIIHQLRETEDLKNLRDHMGPRILFALSVLEDSLSAYIKTAMENGELRSTIKRHMGDEAKRTAAFLGIQPKAKPEKRKAA